jgi:Na+/H+ antiporter NhaD/arsenite permease-like protein
VAPFLTLGLVIVAGAVGDRLGLFRLMARTLIPARTSPRVAIAAVLGFTAILSGAVNLDVAAVVAVPVALRVADRTGLPAGWVAVAVALTANATSFLLPTSNLTTLLVLSRSPLSTWAYVRDSWASWLMVTAVTVTGLALLLGRGHPDGAAHSTAERRLSIGAALDLIPMFVIASAIRALLGMGIALRGGIVHQVAVGGAVAAALNNLPVAAAIHTIGATGLWSAVLAMAIGPNILVTGSVATLICRRLAHGRGVHLSAIRFSLLGLAVVPLQIAVAFAGLRATGTL